MNHIPLEITVISADLLKNINFFTRMRVYALVSLVGDAVSRQRTPADEHGGAKPFWVFPMKFEVEESKLHQNRLMLVFQLRCHQILGDNDIGLLYIPVKELFDDAGGQKSPRNVAYQINSGSGKPKGVLYLSYMFGETTSERVGTMKKADDKVVIEYAVPSAPPCPAPSAPYLPVEGCFPANPTPSAPYIQEYLYL